MSKEISIDLSSLDVTGFLKETAKFVMFKEAKKKIAEEKLLNGTPTIQSFSFRRGEAAGSGYNVTLVINNRKGSAEPLVFRSYLTKDQIMIEYMKKLDAETQKLQYSGW